MNATILELGHYVGAQTIIRMVLGDSFHKAPCGEQAAASGRQQKLARTRTRLLMVSKLELTASPVWLAS